MDWKGLTKPCLYDIIMGGGVTGPQQLARLSYNQAQGHPLSKSLKGW